MTQEWQDARGQEELEPQLVSEPAAWPAAMPPLPVAPGPIAHGETARHRAARDAVLALPLAGPWRRFWARLVDIYFIMLVAGVPAVGATSARSD
jgi:hypothetical protein